MVAMIFLSLSCALWCFEDLLIFSLTTRSLLLFPPFELRPTLLLPSVFRLLFALALDSFDYADLLLSAPPEVIDPCEVF